MNKLLTAGIIGASILIAPVSSFAQTYYNPHRGPVHMQKHMAPQKAPVMKKHRWARGHALPSQYRRSYVSDYRRHHLRAPGPGQRWVRVDNQFILINSITGMIAALAAAR
ncbi:RcnB family protein [Bosea sp. (in: a-proteobacteria)]|uniref:RcnB family protein n=1 Tax=Bosea sp. (in: a-proteobacteria) TaxID=1871050 RepID=UPI00260E8338|nr:RcnB family protein [Bosea sp. (in: a-proteobacteria)]MCO5092099.1 RcnB family protein [Bosea sp. (in: a-proteobacteria)]